MPSPIAHGSVALALWPLMRETGVSRPRQLALGGMLLLGVMGPDLDIAAGLVTGGEAFADHGGPWHSLFAGVNFATIFAAVCSRLAPLRWNMLWLVGAAAWWSHVLLDACTQGRGVALLWPLTDERFSSPVPLFYGVRHSDPFVWQYHLTTVLTEIPFVIAMWLFGCWVSNRVAAGAVRPLNSSSIDFKA